MHTPSNTHTDIHTDIHTHTHTHTHSYRYTHTFTHSHTFKHTHTHTYTYTHKQHPFQTHAHTLLCVKQSPHHQSPILTYSLINAGKKKQCYWPPINRPGFSNQSQNLGNIPVFLTSGNTPHWYNPKVGKNLSLFESSRCFTGLVTQNLKHNDMTIVTISIEKIKTLCVWNVLYVYNTVLLMYFIQQPTCCFKTLKTVCRVSFRPWSVLAPDGAAQIKPKKRRFEDHPSCRICAASLIR